MSWITMATGLDGATAVKVVGAGEGRRQAECLPDQRPCLFVIVSAMKGLWTGLLASLAGSTALLAQEQDRSLERIRIALDQTPPIIDGRDRVESTLPRSFGIFTLVPPTKRGEFIRVSIPIGEFVSRAGSGVAAAYQRRQEAAARRKVQKELKQLEQQQQPRNR
jgi:hypothetical protein